LATRAKARLHSQCFEISDTSTSEIDVTGLADIGRGAQVNALAEVRANALLKQNEGILRDFQITGHVHSTGRVTQLVLTTGSTVGAVPLLSPLSSKVDYGLLIRPRFGWNSIGDVLCQTGMRTVPQILPIHQLPQSDRQIPQWVLSATVIARVEALLRSIDRSFTIVEEDRRRPRGQIMWPDYLRSGMPRGRAHIVPCRFPDLRRDEPLLRAAAFTIRRHQAALRGISSDGAIVHFLLRRCETVLQLLGPIEQLAPDDRLRRQWHRRTLQTKVFTEGIQAIDWTIEERGLAGVAEMSGLPWQLSMEAFFESWVETIADAVGKRAACTVTCGRLNQTRTHLPWRPSWLSSQDSLLPDVVLQGHGIAVVLDAKYKRHLDALTFQQWAHAPEHMRESHRTDLMQVLAYSTLLDAPRVVACLLYPCKGETYDYLKQRNATLARAHLQSGSRSVELALAAAPLDRPAGELAGEIMRLLRSDL
jgi:hypothetical protein